MTTKKTQRYISLFLVMIFLFTQLTGCAKLFGGKKSSGTLNEENTRVGTDTLALDLGDYPLDNEAECKIVPVEAPELPGVKMQAYEFTIDTDEELLSVMALTMPYDEKALGGMDPHGNVGAAYYNEETGQWEPVSFDINDKNATVTIYTDHLSTYGCFITENDNTRRAYAAYSIPSFAMSDAYGVDVNAIITSAVENGGNPDFDAVEAGLSVMDKVMALGSAATDTISHGLNSVTGVMGSAPGNSLFNGISDRMGNLGMALSIAQVSYGMYSIYNGNTDAVFPCYADALKGSIGYTAGKAGMKLFSLAFLGVLAIEMSLNAFGEAAWEGREDIYKKAYNLYYESAGVRRSAKDWARIFLDARETASSPERYQLRVEGLVHRYADQFWQDETIIAEYQSEAQSLGFTGGGGLNEKMKAEISAAYVNELFRGILQDAFKLIAERDARKAEKDLRNELEAIRKELNKTCTIDLYDNTLTSEKTKSDVAEAEVYVTVPDTITDAENWSVTLDEAGSGQIKFTLLAYLMAGMPTELKLYEKGKSPSDDEPTKTISFSMEDFVQRVDVGEDVLKLEDLIGSYEGSISIHAISLSEAGYDQYLSEESDEKVSKAECDQTLTATMQENPLTAHSVSISSDDPQNGQCVISSTIYNDEGDAYPATISASYENGFLIMQSEKGESRVSATKESDEQIRIQGGDVHLGMTGEEYEIIVFYISMSIDVTKVS